MRWRASAATRRREAEVAAVRPVARSRGRSRQLDIFRLPPRPRIGRAGIGMGPVDRGRDGTWTVQYLLFSWEDGDGKIPNDGFDCSTVMLLGPHNSPSSARRLDSSAIRSGRRVTGSPPREGEADGHLAPLSPGTREPPFAVPLAPPAVHRLDRRASDDSHRDAHGQGGDARPRCRSGSGRRRGWGPCPIRRLPSPALTVASFTSTCADSWSSGLVRRSLSHSRLSVSQKRPC